MTRSAVNKGNTEVSSLDCLFKIDFKAEAVASHNPHCVLHAEAARIGETLKIQRGAAWRQLKQLPFSAVNGHGPKGLFG
jgi:hypothetical protein